MALNRVKQLTIPPHLVPGNKFRNFINGVCSEFFKVATIQTNRLQFQLVDVGTSCVIDYL